MVFIKSLDAAFLGKLYLNYAIEFSGSGVIIKNLGFRLLMPIHF